MSGYLNRPIETLERLCDWMGQGAYFEARTNAELAECMEEYVQQLDLPVLTPEWSLLSEVIDRLRHGQTP
jgi:hypothetical protein